MLAPIMPSSSTNATTLDHRHERINATPVPVTDTTAATAAATPAFDREPSTSRPKITNAPIPPQPRKTTVAICHAADGSPGDGSRFGRAERCDSFPLAMPSMGQVFPIPPPISAQGGPRRRQSWPCSDRRDQHGDHTTPAMSLNFAVQQSRPTTLQHMIIQCEDEDLQATSATPHRPNKTKPTPQPTGRRPAADGLPTGPDSNRDNDHPHQELPVEPASQGSRGVRVTSP